MRLEGWILAAEQGEESTLYEAAHCEAVSAVADFFGKLPNSPLTGQFSQRREVSRSFIV